MSFRVSVQYIVVAVERHLREERVVVGDGDSKGIKSMATPSVPYGSNVMGEIRQG